MKAATNTTESWPLWKKLIILLAGLSLGLAYTSGLLADKKETLGILQGHFPDQTVTEVANEKPYYEVKGRDSGLREMLVIVEETQGWGGPLTVGSVIDTEGVLRNVLVLDHKETPSFFDHLVQNGFFRQFADKQVDAPLKTGTDIDAISSATVSSVGFTKGVRLGTHWAGREVFAKDIPPEQEVWKIGHEEYLLIGLYALILICLLRKYFRLRLYVLVLSIAFVGFYANRTISISNIGSLLLGYIPAPHEQLFWWLLVVGTLVLTLLLGKNFYCAWMCPFGGMQEFITKVGGLNFRVSRRLEKILRGMVYFLLWFALMIIFITRNPALGNFEPFAVLFSLHGLGVQWYLVTLALLGAFVIPKFWCRFFCPVGGFLKQVVWLKRVLTARFRLPVVSRKELSDEEKVRC